MSKKLNPQKRLNRRTTPKNDVPGEDENNAVHEYKKCMEEIQSENPHLSVGAQQQMALKRCVKMNEDREGQHGKQSPEPAGILRGMLSKLRIGNNRRSDGRSAATGDDEVGSSFGSSTQESDFVTESNRRSLAIRQRSVASISSDARNITIASIDLSDGGEDGSLQDSLENIEKSSIFLEKSSSRRMKSSRRISELSDVEEDDESNSPDAPAEEGANFDASSSSKDKRNKFAEKSHQFHPSVSNILPDEINFVLDTFKGNKNDTSPSTGQRNSRAASSQQDSDRPCQPKNDESNTSSVESNTSSFKSSIMTVDSADFHGDFSAWSSFRGHAN